MANRQALRDLQVRLAERLQQARSEGVSAGWLAVELGGRRCLLPLAQSGEIFPVAPTQRVPYTQSWYLGVANLRGGLFGVVDLANFIAPGTPQRSPEGSLREQGRLIVLGSALEVNCAILVDRLGGLRNAQDFVSRENAAAESPPFVCAQYTDKTGQNWIELDLQALANTPEFLSIGSYLHS